MLCLLCGYRYPEFNIPCNETSMAAPYSKINGCSRITVVSFEAYSENDISETVLNNLPQFFYIVV